MSTPATTFSTPAAMSSFLATQKFFTTTSTSLNSTVTNPTAPDTTEPDPSASSYTDVRSTSSHNSKQTSFTTSTKRTFLPSSTSVTSHTSNGTTIGAAVGGTLAALALLAIVVGFIVIRKRRHRKTLAKASEQFEKPQLHGEDFHPHREELLGTLGKPRYDHTSISELPAGEVLERREELDTSQDVGAEPGNREKIPETEGSSQLMTVGSGRDG